MEEEIRAVAIPAEIRRRIEFFTSQFEFCEIAADQFEYKTKDTARLVRGRMGHVSPHDTGRDRLKDLGCQTMNGFSVRKLMTLMIYAKAIAYFRGDGVVSLEDVRQVFRSCCTEKLAPDTDAHFSMCRKMPRFRSDRIGWLQQNV